MVARGAVMWPLLLASMAILDEAAWAEAARASDPSGAWRDRAALVPWPLLAPETDADLAVHLDALEPSSRRAWAADRLLPVVVGEIAAPDEWVARLVRAAAPEARPNEAVAALRAARRAYAEGRLDDAAAAYGAVPAGAASWGAALRERAWTDLRRDALDRALGATVTLASPYFAAEDEAEGTLLSASVLVAKCRYDEARGRLAELAAWDEAAPDESSARRAVASGQPQGGSARDAWEAPLVRRVRAALEVASTGTGPMRDRLVSLGTRVFLDAWREAWAARRALAARALALLYDAAREERRRVEASRAGSPLAASARPLLEDDEVAWPFDGAYWRDELGTYRWRAADACGPEPAP